MMALVDDLWMVDFGDPYPGEPASFRPAIEVGPSPIFSFWSIPENEFPFLFVIPLTSSARGLPFHIEIEPTPETGLVDISYAQCELMRSIARRRLVHRLGVISEQESRQVSAVLKALLGH
ncbi:MAG: type II toxin-antitoxin system PemK/MazF family toxin [Acidimicrobiia bacterium]|nr:type II toxin-antitoxin system PemK/MazF family toxin [Acidimicrobiia bacterium]MCY4435694.1 type II toxin-antitoxin system PemK/MazF family toxin [bacterium]